MRIRAHILKLAVIYKYLKRRFNGKSMGEDFASSLWYKLARILADDAATGKDPSADTRYVSKSIERSIQVLDPGNREILSYLSTGPDSLRFIERCIKSRKTEAPHPHQ